MNAGKPLIVIASLIAILEMGCSPKQEERKTEAETAESIQAAQEAEKLEYEAWWVKAEERRIAREEAAERWEGVWEAIGLGLLSMLVMGLVFWGNRGKSPRVTIGFFFPFDRGGGGDGAGGGTD